ncbi:hypothetical protein, partial [Anaeromyxobacter sp. SG26]|uniref:hypothetical protein n=1 Tax=Anaeromyxobacter sp. SG26 TaxID=2925407 RepID=UPI001F589E5C
LVHWKLLGLAAKRGRWCLVTEELPLPSQPPRTSDSHILRDTTLLTMAVKPPLNKADILCTSVAGCTLEGGAQTHDRIRAEVKGAPVFIGLVTSLSTESSYVLFELGARWMAGGRTIPVLGPGEGYDRLPGPWNRNVNALRTDDRAKVLQLVREIAQELGRDVDSPDAWHDEADAVVTHK